jgi:alpha-L-rhamnosidase
MRRTCDPVSRSARIAQKSAFPAGSGLSACLKKERGCVGDQPQHSPSSSTRRKCGACCGWSRTTRPRSGIFRQALRFFGGFLAFTFVCFANLPPATAATTIANLRCENRVNPDGIDALQPRLSWNIESTERNQHQTAYQVLVSSSESKLSPDDADVWNSGKVTSDQSIQLRYAGKPLVSTGRYHWKVGVWDKSGKVRWSKPARWSMGLLWPEDWSAQWIGLEGEEKTNWLSGTDWIWFPEGEPEKFAPLEQRYFRRTFALPEDREVKRARMLMTGDSECRGFVNGHDIGRRNEYRVAREADITFLLRPGQNVIALLGTNRGPQPKPAGVIAKIEIEFDRGEPMILTTDEQWRSRNREEQNWNLPDFDDGAWRAAKKLGPAGMDPWGNTRAPEDRRLPARWLRKEFTLEKRIRRATVYASGLGVSELHLNGGKISDHVLSPALAEYPKRAFYVTHDVTDQLRRGANAIGAVLGNGRYYSPRSRVFAGMPSYGFPKLLLQLRIEHTDGSVTQIVSDDSWKITSNGPIVANNEFDGEEYDARKELTGWSKAGYDSSRWQPAGQVPAPPGVISAQMIEPIRVTQTLKPVAVAEPKPGVFILDLGQNIVGWCRLKVTAPASTIITLRHAESLQPDGTLYLANIRGARATDTYTTRGERVEVWEPRFVYHGFRYVEVTGFPGKPTLDSIEGRVVHDDLEPAGDFISSNPLLNRIYENVVWGIRGNYRSIPTDCPQRDERQGWLGDRSEVSKGESFIFNTQAFHEKWLQDISDAQKETGSVPDVAPSYWPIYTDNVTWPSTTVILPGILCEQFGDLAIVERHYVSAARWVNYMVKNFYTNGVISRDNYGDWCVPPEDSSLTHSRDPARQTDKTLLASSYFFHDLRLMEKYSLLLGKTQEAERFGRLAMQVKTAFNERYLRRDVGFYNNGSQTASVLPLAFGLVPDDMRERVFSQLVNKIENETKGHIGTGVIGGMFLMRTLNDNDRPDLAYTIASQRDYPGWGYMVEKGATTIWELWNGDTADPSMNSGNHIMLVGDLVTWLYENLAGIKTDPQQPGFKHVIMKPEPVGDLKTVRANHRSPYGLISSRWRKEELKDGTTFTWRLQIPPNSTATVYIPASNLESVYEGKLPAQNAAGVESARYENGRAVLEIGSGKYHFTCK